MDRKKIAILTSGLKQGGIDTFIVNLVSGLCGEKYDITVILAIDDDSAAPREHEILHVGVKTIRTCGLAGIKGKLRHFILLYKTLKHGKYDIFQTNIDLFNGGNLFIAWLAGIKIRVCHSHNTQRGRGTEGEKSLQATIYQKTMQWFCWFFSNRRCGCSEQAMNFIYSDKWVKDNKSTVIYNGIDLHKFARNENLQSDCRVKKELYKLEKHNILTVGRIVIQKNPLFLIDCFAALCETRDDCQLLWVGTGYMEQQVKDRIQTYGIEDKVLLLGVRNDVEMIMQESDLFFFPSLFEGLGIVIIEAQAAGLPCVISDVIPSEANVGGCTSVSLDEAPAQWAQVISDILDGKNSLSVNQKELQKFSIAYMVEQMEQVFD